MKRGKGIAVAVGAFAVAAAVAACGGAAHANASSGVAGARHTTKSTTVKVGSISGLGKVLVDSRGLTLYVFEPDKHKKVTCTGSCASVWPPLKLAGAKAVAGTGVKASLLGADANPSGGKVVTYNHWPLYTYVADTKAGQANGQGVNSSGGLWYVISPSGKVITKKVSSGGGGGGWG